MIIKIYPNLHDRLWLLSVLHRWVEVHAATSTECPDQSTVHSECACSTSTISAVTLYAVTELTSSVWQGQPYWKNARLNRGSSMVFFGREKLKCLTLYTAVCDCCYHGNVHVTGCHGTGVEMIAVWTNVYLSPWWPTTTGNCVILVARLMFIVHCERLYCICVMCGLFESNYNAFNERVACTTTDCMYIGVNSLEYNRWSTFSGERNQ